MPSVLYDAELVAPGDESADALLGNGGADHFASESFKHAKAVGALGAVIRLPGVRLAGDGVIEDAGVVSAVNGDANAFAAAFADAIGTHRHSDRELAAVAA
jgi:catalase